MGRHPPLSYTYSTLKALSQNYRTVGHQVGETSRIICSNQLRSQSSGGRFTLTHSRRKVPPSSEMLWKRLLYFPTSFWAALLSDKLPFWLTTVHSRLSKKLQSQPENPDNASIDQESTRIWPDRVLTKPVGFTSGCWFSSHFPAAAKQAPSGGSTPTDLPAFTLYVKSRSTPLPSLGIPGDGSTILMELSHQLAAWQSKALRG